MSGIASGPTTSMTRSASSTSKRTRTLAGHAASSRLPAISTARQRPPVRRRRDSRATVTTRPSPSPSDTRRAAPRSASSTDTCCLRAAPERGRSTASPSTSARRTPPALMNLDDQCREWAGTDRGHRRPTRSSPGTASRPPPGTPPTTHPATCPGHTLCSARPTCSSCAAWPDAAASCSGSPHLAPGLRTGYFAARPSRGRRPRRSRCSTPDRWATETLDFEWDVMRPTQATASQVDLTQATSGGTTVTAASSGLSPLDQRSYASYLAGPRRCCSPRPPTWPSSAAHRGGAGRRRVCRSVHRRGRGGPDRRGAAGRRRRADRRGRQHAVGQVAGLERQAPLLAGQLRRRRSRWPATRWVRLRRAARLPRSPASGPAWYRR